MTRFVDWGETDVGGLPKLGLARLIAEIDDGGVVTRELGFDDHHRLVHRCPGGPGVEGTYGLFDMTKFAAGGDSDLAEDEFNRLWAMPDHTVQTPSHGRWRLGVVLLLVALLAIAALATFR